MASVDELRTRLQAAIASEDWPQALRWLRELQALDAEAARPFVAQLWQVIHEDRAHRQQRLEQALDLRAAAQANRWAYVWDTLQALYHEDAAAARHVARLLFVDEAYFSHQPKEGIHQPSFWTVYSRPWVVRTYHFGYGRAALASHWTRQGAWLALAAVLWASLPGWRWAFPEVGFRLVAVLMLLVGTFFALRSFAEAPPDRARWWEAALGLWVAVSLPWPGTAAWLVGLLVLFLALLSAWAQHWGLRALARLTRALAWGASLGWAWAAGHDQGWLVALGVLGLSALAWGLAQFLAQRAAPAWARYRPTPGYGGLWGLVGLVLGFAALVLGLMRWR